MASDIPIKVESPSFSFSWSSRIKRIHLFGYLQLRLRGTYIFFSAVLKILMKTLLRGKQQQNCAGLPEACSEAQTPQALATFLTEARISNGQGEIPLFSLFCCWKNNVSGQAGVYSQTRSSCLIGK